MALSTNSIHGEGYVILTVHTNDSMSCIMNVLEIAKKSNILTMMLKQFPNIPHCDSILPPCVYSGVGCEAVFNSI